MTRLGITAKLDCTKQVVNVNPVNNISVNVRSPSQIQRGENPKNEVQHDPVYPPPENPSGSVGFHPEAYITPTEDNIKYLTVRNEELVDRCKALGIIIDMFKHNPIYINSLLLVDDEKLSELIKLLTHADRVDIDAEELGEGCLCGAQEYRKVNAIYVIKDDRTFNLKYDFPDVMKELKEIGINTKIIW
ncbi:protein of unknown function, DUF4106 family [Trichomonas vaginalis G3]|uniref:protein of unknown function, DUF4106 family n=1 Tax=Trichomonas vaginalis (strain ATCC PRA-98 / G3) TaxID=412133 RepID=UPI0021E61489|nr:protein of unknown function, DUF4106 family [Trichomonas vaginalis G3]KAI5497342.1 protein of unknown function, DUF4106 family [Trichomonas vaginalis G3]